MKAFFRKSASLILSVLFVVSLLTLPAFASMESEVHDTSDDVLEKFEELFDYLRVYETDVLSEGETVVANSLTCNHPKREVVYVGYTRDPQNPSTRHLKVTMTDIYCDTCGTKDQKTEQKAESHVYPYGRQYVKSSHSGSYSTHTHTYRSTCVCDYVKTETVSAGCRPGSCVDPYSLTSSEFDD